VDPGGLAGTTPLDGYWGGWPPVGGQSNENEECEPDPCEQIKEWLDEHSDADYGHPSNLGGPVLRKKRPSRVERINALINALGGQGKRQFQIERPLAQKVLDYGTAATFGYNSRGESLPDPSDPQHSLKPNTRRAARGSAGASAMKGAAGALFESLHGIDQVNVKAWGDPQHHSRPAYIGLDSEGKALPQGMLHNILNRWCV